MIRVRTAAIGALLLASSALAASMPAKAQSFQIQGYVGSDPAYGADPNYNPYYDQGYQDPAYDPNYAQTYQDPSYDQNYYDPGYDQQYGDSYGYDYDYSDPNYYYTPTYTPLYDPFYDPYCDYYTPPWGFPLDYCRYQTWNQPVYFGGLWYSGPIYYRQISGVPWYWLNGRWCRDEWRGARPHNIDWSRNKYWNGNRHNWRDEYRRGTWAGRNTWVGRNYRDNFQDARRNVLDRGRDRNFRQDFVRNIRERNGGVAGARGRDNRPGFTNDGRDRNNNGFDRRALRDGGSNLVRPNDRRPDVRGNPRVERQFDNRRPNVAIPNQRSGNDNRAFRNEQRAPRNFAAPNQGQRLGGDNRAFRNEQAPRNFAAPNTGQRFDRGAQQRSFAAPQRAPRVESRAPRIENRNFGGANRGAFAAPNSAPRVARPNGGQRFEARGNSGGGARAFSGGGGGQPRASSGGGGGGNRSFSNSSRGGGGAATRGGNGGGNRGGGNRGGRDR